jgi:hypothetical protein
VGAALRFDINQSIVAPAMMGSRMERPATADGPAPGVFFSFKNLHDFLTDIVSLLILPGLRFLHIKEAALKTYRQIADAIGATEARLVTITCQHPHKLSRDEALLVAFQAAAVDVGFGFSEAKLLAAEWLTLESEGRLPRWLVVNPSNSRSLAFNKQDVALGAFAYTLTDGKAKGRIVHEIGNISDTRSDARPPMGSRFRVLNLHEITRRIENLFAANLEAK